MTRITFLFETLSGTFQIDIKLKHKKNRIVRGGNFQGMVLIQMVYCSPREMIRLFRYGLFAYFGCRCVTLQVLVIEIILSKHI